MSAHASAIPGYRYGDPSLPPSPLDAAGFAELRAACLLTDDDVAALREAAPIVEPQIEEILDTWYGFVGSHPFLLASFSTPAGPDTSYLGAVRARFGQWIRDTLRADFGPEWLAYQQEIGRRHASGKNETDAVAGAPEVVPFRFVVALIAPITLTMRPFLARGARDEQQLERMQAAWFKAVVCSVALWAAPYAKEGWW
ncbi:protoglobin domain-containing protein [Tepidiforma sp.]|uniref:protoglobin domain-containing protein n=1 Tax=Tepidiforma sp. TaxID=2682230 RepID=UPI002ADE8C35|nr:protoglobin domain-containing protein [Tepidiforma sp.]